MPFQSSEKNVRWRGGRPVSDKGYIRLKTGHGRDKYEHRAVMERMLRTPVGLVFAGDGEIPRGMHVHHCDGSRQHNCQGNLMLLQECIHNAISRAHKQYLLEHWDEYLETIARENEPEWVREATA